MCNKKPPKCTYPNCFECPYVDCRYDRMEVEDFTESNNRDYEIYKQENGKAYHKGTDSEYRKKRDVAYQRRRGVYVDKHEYNQMYYKENADRIKEKQKENYDTEKNTRMCRKYRKSHKEERKKYEKEYYEKNKDKIKQRAKERYYEKKLERERKEKGL